uniref:CHC2 zinc finger domain-containing protein n=1 Tax=Ruminococcus sp. TaxID=41978 RepID=UPI00386535E3
ICNFYGFQPNRAGFITCPFHSEKTASLKIYANGRRFKCFGCGEGGSVIDFVMKIENLPFKGAIIKLNDVFNLGLSLTNNLTYREREKAKRLARKMELLRDIQNGYIVSKSRLYECLEDCYMYAERIIKENEPFSDLFAKAVIVKVMIVNEIENFDLKGGI